MRLHVFRLLIEMQMLFSRSTSPSDVAISFWPMVSGVNVSHWRQHLGSHFQVPPGIGIPVALCCLVYGECRGQGVCWTYGKPRLAGWLWIGWLWKTGFFTADFRRIEAVIFEVWLHSSEADSRSAGWTTSRPLGYLDCRAIATGVLNPRTKACTRTKRQPYFLFAGVDIFP